MEISKMQKSGFVILLLFILANPSFANEGGKILSNAAPAIILILFFIVAAFIAPIFILVKTAKKRYLTFTIMNLWIFLAIWWTTDEQDYFIIDRIYIFNLQIILQVMASLMMMPSLIKQK